MTALILSAVLAQDGGVRQAGDSNPLLLHSTAQRSGAAGDDSIAGAYVYDKAALLLPSGEILTVDAGIALDGPVALERANELARLRAVDKTPSWLAVALSTVATGVWVADRVRAWTQTP